ncbi:hypothetical protein JXA88_02435 [Candidatus Fermentibacteria bacterium]|nr:hypothetical protein [Candidatus Fermentibacteria bacterium]
MQAYLTAGLAFVCLATATVESGGYTPSRCLTRQVDAFYPRSALEASDPSMQARRGPPPNPQLGDEWLWYIWDLGGYPEASLLPCTVRGMGEHCYVVVENSQWGVTVNQDDVDAIVERFNSSSPGPIPTMGIYDICTQAFGDPPDALDNDPRIYLLYYDFQIGADGYFWMFDQFPDGTQPFASNECEVLYLNSAAADPGGDYLLAVAAHEFQHMIHFRHDANEASWVDEGMSELAMYLYGHPDVITGFPSNPDNNLTVWNGSWADYIKVYLWSLYLFEHHGGVDLTWALVHEPANGIAGYDTVLAELGYSERFTDVFLRWVVANFIDDTSFADGIYGYSLTDLPGFAHSLHTAFPVEPLSRFVNHWAADYVVFRDGTDLSFSFDGADNEQFMLQACTRNTGTTLSVQAYPAGAGQAASFSLPEFGIAYEDAVVIITSIASTGSGTYQYEAAASPPGIPPITDLVCTAVNGSIVLAWSARPFAQWYSVYAAQAPYFATGSVTPTTVMTTTFTHVDAVLPGASWYYLVRGQNLFTESIDSNRVGAATGGLDLPG